MTATYLTSSLALLLCVPLALHGQSNQLTLSEKLQRIRLPLVELNNANAIDVADYLIYMTDPNPPFRTSIILNLEKADARAQRERDTDPRRPAYKDLPNVTITLTNASMLEAVERLTAAAGLGYAITNGTVIIKGPDGKDLNRKKWANQAVEAIGASGSPQPHR